MKKIIVLAILLAAARFVALHPVHAQTSAPAGPAFEYVASKSSCTTALNTTVFCYAADTGLGTSMNGAAFTWPANAQITINGKTGTSFTITATSTAPTITASSTSPTVSVAVN